MAEWQDKQKKLAKFMSEKGIELLHLSNWRNFAWLTGGKQNQVGLLTDTGVASILIAPEGKFILTNSIEFPRLRDEEDLLAQGYRFQVIPWFEALTGKSPLPDLVRGRKLFGDTWAGGAVDISNEINRLRYVMVPEEIDRYQKLGIDNTAAVEIAARQVKPGMTEYEIAALLNREARTLNIIPFACLVATDERIANYRHPVPQNKRLEKQAMLGMAGRRGGLCAPVTRTVYFGAIPDELRRRQEILLQVEVTLITATKAGLKVKDIFARAMAKYAELGWPDEWKMHHQGGCAGYNGREFLASPFCQEIVQDGQAFAWNPTVKGAKSEDAFVVKATGRVWITGSPDWPAAQVEMNGEILTRPIIMEIK
jgi:Xaa-Pro aminopeptidase